MKPINFETPSQSYSRSILAQARLLMSQSRQKRQNRRQSMLSRAVSALGMND